MSSSTAEIAFVKGEGGEVLDIPLTYEGTGDTMDTSGYTAATMTFKSLDELTVLKTIVCSIPSNGVARWSMTTTDTNITFETATSTNRMILAQIELTGTGLVKKTFKFYAYCEGSLT